MADKRNLYLAKCSRTGQFFLIESRMVNGSERVDNFVDLTDDQAEKVQGGGGWPQLDTAFSLRSCRWCGGRRVGGCDCLKRQNRCPRKGEYNFQCLYCSDLRPARGVGNVRDLRLSVTAPRYDDIGAILGEMGLDPKPFARAGFDCDILFLNCGTPDVVNPGMLRSFVLNGGCVYASDWADNVLKTAFPDKLVSAHSGDAGKYPARVEDPELREVIGSSIEVNMDLGSWAVVREHKGSMLIGGRQGVLRSLPLMISFTEGKGRVFYTSFHNHKQASQREKDVLKVMLLRQIGSVTGQSITDLKNILGLNIF